MSHYLEEWDKRDDREELGETPKGGLHRPPHEVPFDTIFKRLTIDTENFVKDINRAVDICIGMRVVDH